MDSTKYKLPEPFVPPRGPDLRRAATWCGYGTLVMFLWLLYPTLTCSWQKFRDVPDLAAYDDQQLEVWRADKERIDRAEGLADRWWTACQTCYQKTPVFGQSQWKSNLLVLFVIGWLGAHGAVIHYRRRRRTTF